MIGSAAATEFWAFLLARLLLGLGSGAVGPAIRRIVITRDPDTVGANLGRLAAFDVAGFMLGPLVAAVVAEAFGIRAPFVFLAAVFVGIFVLAVAPRPHRRRHDRLPRADMRCASLLVRPAIQATLAACVAFYVTVGMFEAIWAVLLRDHGAETWLIGLTLSLFTVPMIFLAPIGGKQAQARGPLRVVSVSLTIATICTFSYGVLPSLWMLLAVSLIHAVADSFTMPSNQVAAALGSPPEHLSAAQGLLGATGLAAAGLTGLVTGLRLRGGRPGRRVHRHRGRHDRVPRDRDHPRSPSSSPTRRRCVAPTRPRRPTPSAAASPTCPEGGRPDAEPDRSDRRRRRGVHPPDRRHVRDGRHERPVVDREGLRDGDGARRVAPARLRARQVHEPQRDRRVRRRVARRRAGDGAGEPPARPRTRAHRHRADPLRGARAVARVRFALDANDCQPIAFEWTFEPTCRRTSRTARTSSDGYRMSADLVRYHQIGVGRPAGSRSTASAPSSTPTPGSRPATTRGACATTSACRRPTPSRRHRRHRRALSSR